MHLRIKNNYIVWEDSYLYVDNYSIAFDNPLSLMKCVYSLRDKGISIKKSYYELDKINQKKWDFEKFETTLSIQELIDLYRETPTDFEQYCASLFERIGLKSFVTPPSNDGGYDIKLFKNSSLYALVECKLYEDTKVSRPQIQKLVGASAIENTNNLIFITTSDFSNEAIEFAKKTDVHLLNGKALVKFSNYVSKNESNQFDENSVQLNIYDFAKYMPKDILAMCYDEI